MRILQSLLFISLGLVISGYQFHDPNCASGRHAIVHLFEWKWSDIAQECERFLGPYGYCGVQTSPPNENRVVTSPYRPWWERYQPVSYKLSTRSGNEQQFRDMVERCNKVNVRIYVDTVINHMTGAGGSGHGTGGSYFNAGSLSFPAVPFGSNDFNNGANCHSSNGDIHNYNNADEVRNCRLVGLLDLAQGHDYVRGKIADYMNHLIDIGVAGFRVDAAKHMWPGDLTAIFSRLRSLNSHYFGGNAKPFMFLEVIDMGGNEPIKADQYFNDGRITNFIYGSKLGDEFKGQNTLKYLKTWGAGWGMIPSDQSVVFIDNHDNQRHHGGGGSIITHKTPRDYKMATAFMLAHPYGFARVMSSFSFTDPEAGPPHNGDSISDVHVNSDQSCSGGWVCEHRWRQIYNMVAFRNIAYGTGVDNWWDNGNNQIAFSRGNKAFIAINRDGGDIDTSLQTGLPQGAYCDVITGNLENGRCTGPTIHVGGDGRAQIHVSHSSDDPMVAIHAGAKVGSSSRRTG